MGLPLASLSADVFMAELERSAIPNLTYINLGRCYVNDTICFANIGSNEYFISVLNSFHRSIQFIYKRQDYLS